ncbi:MAG TPA: response regulator [Thermoanaerobaculia bacterium]|nr:response regulator [Thermoanaerobaculia bacterium]
MSSNLTKGPSREDTSAAPRIRILHLEDNRGDRLLVRSVFEAEGLDCEFVEVETREAFAGALERDRFDLILSDYALPAFDGISALAIAREKHAGVPFVFFSGTMGEELAIETLKAGATDYVLKERITRLVPSVRRALAEAQERRRSRTADAALRESEERYRSIVEATNEWIWSADIDGRMTYNNQVIEAILGYAPDELAGKGAFEYIHEEDRPAAIELLKECVAARRGWNAVTLRWRHKDGTYRSLESNAVPIFGRGGELLGYRGADRDITERIQLEAQLHQSQKMEAIGQLAGGVAHDFNNLLTVILGYCDLLATEVGERSPLLESVSEIRKAGERAASLTRQLLAFSRRQVLEPKVIEINALVSNVEKMLERLIGEDMNLVTVLDPAVGRVRADAWQIEQVILNLAVNARDAMPRGGKLAIETSNVDLDEAYAREHVTVRPGRYIMLAVSDTGAGMSAETKSHMFEPFFTTKGQGKGTGLGLATVYGIVKQSGGYIWVYSEVGRGTTFKVYLPRVDAEADEKVVPAVEPSTRGTETILLVEDDQAVRALTHTLLESKGYKVLEASGAQEAIAIVRGAVHPIDLLLTDVVMPEMGGSDLSSRLAVLRPGIKVLYMSGYTDDAVVRHGLVAEGTRFLQKPFTPDVLARKLREVLDS